MTTLAFRIVAVVVGAVAMLSVLASRSVAQSAENADPYKTVVVVTAPSPYWGYTYSPYGDIIRAEGDFLIKSQQAYSLREKVRRERLQTERLRLEHWEWKREFLAAAENRQRERTWKAKVERSRTLPPLTEIFAAISLNNLLDELRMRPELPTEGSIVVEAEWLGHINHTVDDRGSVGLLNGDKIFWPQLLLRSEFTGEREKIDQFLHNAKNQVLISPTFFQNHSEDLNELRRYVRVCEERLKSFTKSNDPACGIMRCIGAKRFLEDVKATIAILEKRNADYYFSPLQGKTVADLVAYMNKKGIRFARATDGCEPYYVALHRALAKEVTRLQNLQPSAGNP